MQTLVGRCTHSSKICTHFETVSKFWITHNKKRTFVYRKFSFCLSKPQAWYIIAARSAVHIISPCGAVSHHAPACISLRLDDIPQQIADDIQDYASIYLRKCDIMKLMILWILFFCLQEQEWRSPFVVLCFCKMRRKGAYREIRTFTKKMYERDSLFYLQIRYFMV